MNYKRKNRAGLKAIADHAGASIATVSRVINCNPRVDPAIRTKVREAALALGVNLEERIKSRALVFAVSNREILHPFHSLILAGAQAECTLRGWDVLFICPNYPLNAPRKELHLPRVFQRHDIARGVLLAGTNSQSFLELLVNKGIPFAVLGNNVIGNGQNLQADVVFSDDIKGAYEMTRYLQRLNHRDIWFVGTIRLPWTARCYEGYRRAMEEAGLPPRVSSISADDDKVAGYLSIKSLLGSGERVSAILSASDLTAQGVYKALSDFSLRVPDDVSVAACSDAYGAMLSPPLTTIREFPEQLGKHLVDLVVNRIFHPDLGIQQFTIPTELVERNSCRSLGAGAELASDRISKLGATILGNSTH